MSHVDDGTLHAYLDGELPPAERARLEAHLAECPACRTRLEEERALVERAGQLLGLAQPVERPAPPMHQLRRPRLVWRRRVPLAWAASLLMAVGLGYYLGEASYAPASRQVSAMQAPADSLGPMSRADGFQRFQERAAPAAPTPETAAPPAARQPSRPSRPAAREEGVADQLAAKANDSSAVASGVGVVAIREAPGLRPANPAPVPNAAVVIVDGASRLEEVRGRLGTTQWPIILPGPARQLLGADPVGVPGLAVRHMRRSPTGEVVLVEQTIDSATVIQIFQERMEDDRSMGYLQRSAAPAESRPFRFAERERLARFVGALRVEITGPLSSDSLNRLLEQVKPIKP